MTHQHNLSQFNHGEYELLIKMDKTFQYIDTPHHFYFTIENPSNDSITFSFKVRNFVNTTEDMNTTITELGPDPEQCLEEESEDEEEENPIVYNTDTGEYDYDLGESESDEKEEKIP